MSFKIEIEKYHNILLPRFDTLGDIVLLEGLIRVILQRSPEARIELMVRDSYEKLAELFPQKLSWKTVDIINPHTREADIEQAEILLGNLNDTLYDLALFTTYDRTWADDLVAARVSSAFRVAFGEQGDIQGYLLQILRTLGIDSSPCPYDEFLPMERRIPETEKYQLLWQEINGKPAMLPAPQLLVSGDAEKKVDEIIKKLDLEERSFIFCCPAGTANVSYKLWPSEKFAKIISYLEKNFCLRTLVVGQTFEKAILEKVYGLAIEQGADPAIWIGQDSDIPLLCSLAKRSLFYLGNDTGPMHMAAALDKPVVAMFGGGTWPRFVPLANVGRVFYFPLPCFNCEWNCLFDEVFCINCLPTDIVIAEIKIFIKRIKEGIGDFLMIEVEAKPEQLCTILENAIDRLRGFKSEISSLNGKNSALISRLENCEKDRIDRLEVIQELGQKLDWAEADREARLQVIIRQQEEFGKKIQELEADREARLQVIIRQQEEFEKKIQEIVAKRNFK